MDSETTPLQCRKCGRKGSAQCDHGVAVRTDDNFYLRVKVPLTGVLEIVCRCGTIQRPAGSAISR